MFRPTRRRILVSIPAVAVAAACRDKGQDTGLLQPTPAPAREPEPEDWSPTGEVDDQAFPYGVQIGDAQSTTARLSVHTTELQITLVLAMAIDDQWQEVDRQEGLVVEEGLVQLDLEGLSADTAWSVAIYASDGSRRSAVTRFRTALDDDIPERVVVFGASSCFGGNEPWPNLRHAADERLDFFCLLGDTVYADGSVSKEDFDEHWRYAMQQTGMRKLCGSTSLIATWDDHEVDNNWTWDDANIDEVFTNGLARFSAHLPHIAGGGVAGIWRQLSWGTVLDVFVLDCRSERDAAAEQYISAAQMDWLKDGLSNSRARFKIILNSVPISDMETVIGSLSEDDRWSGHAEQRTEILSHIVDNGIEGVLWVSGDVHFAAASTVGQTGQFADNVHEVIAGPSGSFLNIAVELAAQVDTQQYPVLFAQWNYTRFSCDPGTGIVNIRFIGDDGDTIDEVDFQL